MSETAAPRVFSTRSYTQMPGHWILASMGKKVLRPGGLELSTWMIENLKITSSDDVVEFAPGLGRTARITLANQPKSYTGVEQNENAAGVSRKSISEIATPNTVKKIQIGEASASGLPDASATRAYGEAFLTMQSPQGKQQILKEISRILKPGSLYGIHELSVESDSPEKITKAQRDLSESIRVNAKPIRLEDWKQLITEAGFEVVETKILPMALLEPGRLLRDEGIMGLSKMAFNLALHPSALARVKQMRMSFRKHSDTLRAVGIIARKK